VTEAGYFKSGDNELSYSCSIPSGQNGRTGVVFVHAADGNRLGPHRMFVEFANSYNFSGYPTFRFDLRGCGDSTGKTSRDDIAADVFDTTEAIKFFMARADLENVILFGISRGAHVCYNIMVKQTLKLSGMILLSTPTSSNKAALNSLRVRLREYFHKLKDPKHLWKLLSGRANIRQIWRTLTTALQLRNRYAQSERKFFATKCPVLFVYGGQDPTAGESSRYYITKCNENNTPYDCHFVADANHSFFHYKWKEEILGISKQWLQRNSN
jgi:pimeloyl-ACP methyl ester carboxylesterase